MSETPVVISRLVEAEAEGRKAVDAADLEERDAPDIRFGLTVDEESSSSYPDYDVVALHGLRGDSHSTWKKNAGNGIWLKDKLLEYKDVRMIKYDYDIDESSGAIYTRKGLIDAAVKLLDGLMELRTPEEMAVMVELPKDEPKDGSKDNTSTDDIPKDDIPKDDIPKDDIPKDDIPKDDIPKDDIYINGIQKYGIVQDDAKSVQPGSDPKRPLIFVAHDLGGIVVKQALFLASVNPSRWGNITASTASMIFFGTPHRCHSPKDMEENLTRLLFHYGKPNRHEALRVVKGLSDSVMEINACFLDTKLLIRASITNVYSDAADPLEQIFDKFTATMNIPFENRVRSSRPHYQLVMESDGYNRSIGDLIGNVPYPLDLTPGIAQYLPILLTQASIVFPSTTTNDPHFRDPEVSWIDNNETFLKWLGRNDTSILHVYGTSRITAASEYIFHYIDSTINARSTNSVLYFQFQRNDARFNNVKSMLSTFLAYIISHYTNLDDWAVRGFKQMVFHRSWTDRDLYRLWASLRPTLLIDGITYVIAGIELCDDSKNWFLDELLALSKCSEARFKIVITGKGRQEALSEFPAVDLDENDKTDKSERDKTLRGIVNFEIVQLLQKCPQYWPLEQKLREVLSEGGDDFRLRRLIIDWLNFVNKSETNSATKEILAAVSPVTLASVVKMIMESIPPEKKSWARKLISWVSFGRRRLTTWELSEALILGKEGNLSLENTVLPDVFVKTQEYFGSMFYIDDNEIIFGHPDLRDVFVASDSSAGESWYQFPDEGKVHEELATSCLQYLSLPEVQKNAEEFCDQNKYDRQYGAMDCRFDFLSYATRYWPYHYKLTLSKSPGSVHVTSHVIKFVENAMARNAWAKAFHILSNPVTRSSMPLSSTLSIFSALGLDALVNCCLEKREQEEQPSDEERTAAVIEAARNGYPEIMRLLMKYSKPTLSDSLQAMNVAEATALPELLEYAASSIENSDAGSGTDWPDPVSRAAWLGVAELVKDLAKAGYNVNTQANPLQMSPLHLAARNNHPQTVNVLLAMDASLSLRDEFGSTPLKTACIQGNLLIVELIINAKPDIDVEDDSGWTSLQYACLQGSHQIVKLLLKAGANKNVGIDGEQPLFKAIEAGNLECCRALLEHGADPEPAKDVTYRTPLWFAADGSHLEICRLLLDNEVNLNWKSDSWAPILHLAVQNDNIEMIKLLLDRKADIEIEDDSSYAKATTLSRAAEKGSKEIVSLLIEREAEVNHSGAPESAPLYVAAREGHLEIIKLLIEAHADVNVTTEGNWSPLHIAYDFPEVARVLLENKADINRLSEGGTPLFLASRWDYPEAVKVYLEYKADLEIELVKEGYYDGFSALSIAVEQGNTEIVRLLLDAGANKNQRTRNGRFPLLLALNRSSESEETLRIVLEYNPSLTTTDDDGDTALNCLTSRTPVSAVKLLINAGMNPEIGNKKGYTALCIAAREVNVDVVKYLLSKKARVNIMGARHGGPLHLACSFGSLELVKVLAEAAGPLGVNQVCPGIWGTPLQCICYRGVDPDDTLEIINAMVLYVIEEEKAEINAYGGQFGYALSAACLKSPPEVTKLLLDKGARTDVEDELGRKPIHLAAFRSVEHIELLLDDGKLTVAEDKLKRTPLHYAVVSGRVDIVKRILDLAPELLDAPDSDGWTPLLWAPRICGKWFTTTDGLPEIVELLLSRGADPWVRGEGLDREWTPLRVARYYGHDVKIIALLTPKSKERVKDGEIETWDDRLHLSRKAIIRDDGFCDACLLILAGSYFVCQTCEDFCLCFKCYQSRDDLHLSHHFEEVGPEYVFPELGTSPERRASIPYDDGATVLSLDEEDSDDESHEEEEEVTGEGREDDLRNGFHNKDEEEEEEEEDDD